MSAKPLRWFSDAITVPPFSRNAALRVGAMLEVVALGGTLTMPHSRPLPSVGPRCHELRVKNGNKTWRVIYHIGDDAIVVLDVFSKKTRATPKTTIDRCKRRLNRYEKGR
jgi:phage-related protein